jgi:hypothetical protein
MPAKNLCHDAVCDALRADGWNITDDPLALSYGGRDLYVDLGAERITIGAQKGTRRIAVEIHSFLSLSPVRDLEEAVGQYEIYLSILQETNSDRQLYLAVPRRVADGLLSEQFGQLILKRLRLQVLVFDEEQQRIVKWIE